jgi:hypothetical protein
MRLRVGLLLCLLAIIAGVGCRKALAPNIDRNKAPETWITAAPFDTVTLAKGERPSPGTIPVRFHVYWAGGDQDGAVVGYYVAVVETLPPTGGAVLPPLPGPRPADYHYTARTDSTFIFEVGEATTDRQHAFYIYAVDNQGKPDPTPARFIFIASDRFTPLAVFDQARATGKVFFLDGGILRSEIRAFDIRDSAGFNPTPSDTVPSESRLTFRFHGEVTLPGSVVKGFRYRLDESELLPRDPDSLYHKNIVEYQVPPSERDPDRGGADTLRLSAGTKIFTLRAVDRANGSRVPDFTRRFQMNFSPETWFAGPDPGPATDPGPASPWKTKVNGEKYAIASRIYSTGLPGTLLSADSTLILPAARVPRRTFLELWSDTVYLRHQGDTVHLNSYVIFHNGGFDRDSPYAVKVAEGAATPPGPVLEKDVQNGSPIGFRSRVTNLLTKNSVTVGGPPQNGPLSFTAESRLYPFFDLNDVLNFQRIGAYHPMFQCGKAYALERAEDGDGARDGRVDDARRVHEFPRDAYERTLDSLVLVFYVDYPPELKTESILFKPKPLDTFTSQDWVLYIDADDVDPYVSGAPYGGPSGGKILRVRFKVTGKDAGGADFTFYDPPPDKVQQKYFIGDPNIHLHVPSELQSGLVTLTVELCDCSFCEITTGEGRCVTRDIQVNYVRPIGAAAASAGRPGSE